MKGRVVQILLKYVNFGNEEMNVVAHNLGFIDLNMRILSVFMLHNIQKKVVEEINYREDSIHV